LAKSLRRLRKEVLPSGLAAITGIAFPACSFNHSDISPFKWNQQFTGREGSAQKHGSPRGCRGRPSLASTRGARSFLTGETNCFAFLIDMNRLFEMFVFRLVDTLVAKADVRVH